MSSGWRTLADEWMGLADQDLASDADGHLIRFEECGDAPNFRAQHRAIEDDRSWRAGNDLLHVVSRD